MCKLYALAAGLGLGLGLGLGHRPGADLVGRVSKLLGIGCHQLSVRLRGEAEYKLYM